MNKKKLFAVVISLALVIGVVLPGTLALSTDQTSSNGTNEVPTETTTPAPDTTETPVPEGTEAPAETPTEEPVKTCTCDPKPAEGEAHKEGCPLYVAPEQPAEAEKTCTCDPKPAEGEAHKEGCPLYVAPEQPAEAEKVCTCDPKPAEGEAHLEGCPLYGKPTEENPFKELYDKLMATASIVEFKEICAAYTDDDIAQFEKWVVENGLLDSLQSHIYAISPAPTMPETVVFTDAGPFMPPVDVADSGSGN